MTEQDMAARVVRWLEADGWQVFQEVTHPDRGNAGRADIVATKCGRLRVIECKLRLSFDLLSQGARWARWAHEVCVAVPHAKRSDGRDVAFRVCALLGLGAIEVKSLWPTEEGHVRDIRVREEPARRESISPGLLDSLSPEHQTHARAGSSGGGQFSPFRATCLALSRIAQAEPGVKLKDALKRIPHHYSSVASGVASMAKWAEKGNLHGFELRDGAIYPAAGGAGGACDVF